MPELPEVETIKRGLTSKIIGLNIKSVQILNPKTFQGDVKDVEGKKVVGVWRRAKMLGIDLSPSLRATAKQSQGLVSGIASSAMPPRNDENVTLLFHLKMSGQLIFIAESGNRKAEIFAGGHPTPDMKDEMPNNSTRVIFTFEREAESGKGEGKQSSRLPTLETSHLYFNDQRKFGWIKVVKSTEVISNKLLNSLGPEPLEKEFNWQVLRDRVGKHKSWPVKVALMDQQVVAGVGNIYASEACFNAKLDPRKKVDSITDSEWKRLFIGLIKALEDGITHGGSSRAHFVNAEGEKGLFLDYAFVYQRDGEKCKVCGTAIERIQQAGRSTFYCPRCQK